MFIKVTDFLVVSVGLVTLGSAVRNYEEPFKWSYIAVIILVLTELQDTLGGNERTNITRPDYTNETDGRKKFLLNVKHLSKKGTLDTFPLLYLINPSFSMPRVNELRTNF